MIQVEGLSKTYGKKQVLHDVSFNVEPGKITGFLGPNGAGKSTAMRLMLGLDRPSAGSVLINGEPYDKLKNPLAQVGALLDARAVHPGRTAGSHLKVLATTHGIDKSRVEEVAAITGLSNVLNRRVGGFSLGMGQRLGIASALLGDPKILILDEPVNGLDPEGMIWVRQLLKALAAEGRTIFLSSHLMSEMAMTADHLVVIGKGRILANANVEEFLKTTGEQTRVQAEVIEPLVHAMKLNGMSPTQVNATTVTVPGARAAEIGQLALANRVPLIELSTHSASLEDAYIGLTQDHVEYAADSQTRTIGEDTK